jgi:hypothetical protein
MIIGGATVTITTSIGAYQIFSAKMGHSERMKRFRKGNIQSVAQYLELAIRNRWCITKDLKRNIVCNPGLLNETGRATERITLAPATLEKLKSTGAIPSDQAIPESDHRYPYIKGSIPSNCSLSDLASVAESHPLKQSLTDFETDYKCLRWAVRRECASQEALTSAPSLTDCSVQDSMGESIGDEVRISLSIELVHKNLLGKNLKLNQLLAVSPRRIFTYSAIFKGDLSASPAYNLNGQGLSNLNPASAEPMIRSYDSRIRFPTQSGTDSLKSVIFHGPVLTNGDLILQPIPAPSASPRAQVTFNDTVYLSGGRVRTYNASTGALEELQVSDPTIQLAKSSGFGGLKKGVLQDASPDPGIECLLPNQFEVSTLMVPQGSEATGYYPQQCLAGVPLSRLAAFVRAQGLGDFTNTQFSALLVRQHTGGFPWAGPTPAPGSGSSAFARQSLILGLSEKNYFKSQSILNESVKSKSLPTSPPFTDYFRESNPPLKVSPEFPQKPSDVWGSTPPVGANNQAQWADFNNSVSGSVDPRLSGTRNDPIVRAFFSAKKNNAYHSMIELGLGVRDRFEIPLKPWLPKSASVTQTPWQNAIATTTGSCEVPIGSCVQNLKCGATVFPCEVSSPPPTLGNRYTELKFAYDTIKGLKADLTLRKVGFAQALSGALNFCNQKLQELKTCCNENSNSDGDAACNSQASDALTSLSSCESPLDSQMQQMIESGITGACESKENEFFLAKQASSQTAPPLEFYTALPTLFEPERLTLEAAITDLKDIVDADENLCPANLNALPSGRIACADDLIVRSQQILGEIKNRFDPLFRLIKQAPEAEAEEYLVGETAPMITQVSMPKIEIESRPIAHRHTLAGKGSNTESARYYWRSDQVRLDLWVRDTEYLDWSRDDFSLQMEIEAFDAASSNEHDQVSLDSSARELSTLGPNCSRDTENDSQQSCASTNFNSSKAHYLKSPNILRFKKPPLNVAQWKPDFNFDSCTTAPCSISRVVTTANAILSGLYSTCHAQFTEKPIRDTWDDMRCSDPGGTPILSQVSKNFSPGHAWIVDVPNSDQILISGIKFMGDTPGDEPGSSAPDTLAYDPIELLYYDQKVLAGSDGSVPLAESFAAKTARISWSFNRPRELNSSAFVEEEPTNVIFGLSTESAQSQVSARSLPITQYNSNDQLLNPAPRIWTGRGSFASSYAYSLMQRCVVLPEVKVLVGFYVCDRLEIESRTPAQGDLFLIGSFILGQLDLPKTLAVNIHFYPLDHPLAQRHLRENQIFKTSPPAPNPPGECPSVYGRSTAIPSLLQMSEAQKQIYLSCEASSIRGLAVPFRWTVIDPECGPDPSQNNEWRCQVPDWFRRFRLLRLGGEIVQ